MITPAKNRMMAKYLTNRGKNSGKDANMKSAPIFSLLVGLLSIFFGADKTPQRNSATREVLPLPPSVEAGDNLTSNVTNSQ